MAAHDNIINKAAVVAALDQEFVANFSGEYERFAEILGLFPVQVLPAGTTLYKYSISGSLLNTTTTDGSSGSAYVEGDFIARSKYTLTKSSVGSMEFKPYAKESTGQAIQKGAVNNAILRTDKQMGKDIRGAILVDFFTALSTNASSTASGVGLQAAIAQAAAKLSDTMETRNDEPGRVVYFVNPYDIADYLANANVTVQNVFGMRYLQSFLGVEDILITNKVSSGTIIATPVDNIHVYGMDFSTLDDSGLSYETDELGLVGVHHAASYDRASVTTYALRGATFLPEITDYIVKATISEATTTTTH
jgi:hypothetical protein